jgi:serine/threonine-protein kinase
MSVKDVFGVVGTTVAGAFRVEEVVAEGGYGVVYRAEHVAFRGSVALKCLKVPDHVQADKRVNFVERFREEAEILFHLSAQIPEVVRPLHADTMTLESGELIPYLVMEWVDGTPLDSIVILREQDGLPPLEPRKAVRMLTPIAQALARAHHFETPDGYVVSVTHCDLKPENILITERGSAVRAKILDFGIANTRELASGRPGDAAADSSAPFTPSYGAPEQWLPQRYGPSGPWTDVWGLALTLVECLTGQPPIDGEMHAMMATILDSRKRPTPRQLGAEVSDAVEAVFDKALAVDPQQRYRDVEPFWTELERALGKSSSFERARRRRERPTLDEPASEKPLAQPQPAKPQPAQPQPAQPQPAQASSTPPMSGAAGFDLDLGSLPPHPPDNAPRPHTAPGARRPPEPRLASERPPETLGARLRLPLLLVGAALALTMLDMVLARQLGGTLALGPVRMRWIAALLAAAGIVLAFWNLLAQRDGD